MEIPAQKIVKLLVEHDPASAEFRDGIRETLHARSSPQFRGRDFDLWKDVFVEQKLPWERLLLSAVLHVVAINVVLLLSIAWLREQKILETAPFDRSSVIT